MEKENSSIEVNVMFKYRTFKMIYVEKRVYNLIKDFVVYYEDTEIYPKPATDNVFPHHGTIRIIGDEKSLTKLKLML